MKGSNATVGACPEFCEGQVSTIIRTLPPGYTAAHSTPLAGCDLPNAEGRGKKSSVWVRINGRKQPLTRELHSHQRSQALFTPAVKKAEGLRPSVGDFGCSFGL